MHAQYPGNGPSLYQEPGVWWLNTVSRAFHGPQRHRTDEAQQTGDVFAGVVFVLRMYACPFSKKLNIKLMHFIFPLKTLPSGTQITMKDENLHAQSACFLKDSKLRGTAGVALQQPHDGRIALGTFYELLQRELTCVERQRSEV